MTFIGHTLTGLAIGIGCMPEYESSRARIIFPAMFSLVAFIPDLPLPYWGHHRYMVSHGLFINLALIAVVVSAAELSPTWWQRIGKGRTLFYGALAWLSHLVLDAFYNHGNGIQIFWPLWDARLILPMPWFEVLTPPMASIRNLRVFLIEFLFYMPVFLAVSGIRRLRFRD